MKNRTCIELKDVAFPISLTQQGKDRFTVTYGRQVTSELTYAEAAYKLGCCIMHALACDGKLDNRERGEV